MVGVEGSDGVGVRSKEPRPWERDSRSKDSASVDIPEGEIMVVSETSLMGERGENLPCRAGDNAPGAVLERFRGRGRCSSEPLRPGVLGL